MTENATPTIGLRGVPTWIITAVCLALVAAGAFIYWSGGQGRDEDQALAQPVFEATTIAQEDALKKCLAGESGGAGILPNADKAWKDTASGDRGYNPARHLFVDLLPNPGGDGYKVQVLTRQGEALAPELRKIVEHCTTDKD